MPDIDLEPHHFRRANGTPKRSDRPKEPIIHKGGLIRLISIITTITITSMIVHYARFIPLSIFYPLCLGAIAVGLLAAVLIERRWGH